MQHWCIHAGRWKEWKSTTTNAESRAVLGSWQPTELHSIQDVIGRELMTVNGRHGSGSGVAGRCCISKEERSNTKINIKRLLKFLTKCFRHCNYYWCIKSNLMNNTRIESVLVDFMSVSGANNMSMFLLESNESEGVSHTAVKQPGFMANTIKGVIELQMPRLSLV